MALLTKCILHEKCPRDGTRISVMTRHTLEDGKTPDLRIRPDSFDEHLCLLALSAHFVGAYYRREIGWAELEDKYLGQLRTHKGRDLVQSLAKRALSEDITIMCIEETAEFCHRRILAEECLRHEPDLIINHH